MASIINIEVSEKFKKIFETKLNDIVLGGGRASGKTKISVILSVLMLLQHNKVDGIVARANYGSISDSLFNEFCEQINEIGDEVSKMFIFKKNPLRIEKYDGSTIYFQGYGGSNTSRTKGIHTLNPVSFVIFDETQELKLRENYDQAKASFRRNYGANVKEITIFNPPAAKAHWINMYFEECKKDEKILTIKCDYRDVWQFLNDFDKRAIIKEKILNYENYRYMYLGEPTGGKGLVYPMLKDSFLITPSEYNLIMLNGLKIVGVVIGVDGAVSHDATCAVPLMILNNGQVIVSRVFYHDPRLDSVIGYHTLVEKYMTRWFQSLIKAHNLDAANVPIYIRCDSAASDLIQELNYFFGDRADVGKIRKGSILEMVGNVQSPLSNEMIYFMEEHKHYNYVRNERQKDDMNIVFKQLEMLLWNANQNGYDPGIPNDASDAFTYACRFYFVNIENIAWFNIVATQNKNCVKIKSLLGR